MPISKDKLWYEYDYQCVRRMLDEWVPTGHTLSEKEQEVNLIEWLRQKLPHADVQPQYGNGRGRGDIVIDHNHLIELKLGFKTVNELNRCIGQLVQYQQSWMNSYERFLYLVIVGPSKPELKPVLETWFWDRNNEGFRGIIHNDHYQLIGK